MLFDTEFINWSPISWMQWQSLECSQLPLFSIPNNSARISASVLSLPCYLRWKSKYSFNWALSFPLYSFSCFSSSSRRQYASKPSYGSPHSAKSNPAPLVDSLARGPSSVSRRLLLGLYQLELELEEEEGILILYFFSVYFCRKAIVMIVDYYHTELLLWKIATGRWNFLFFFNDYVSPTNSI